MTNRDHSPSISQNDGGDAKLRTEGSGLDLDALEAVARAAVPGPWKGAIIPISYPECDDHDLPFVVLDRDSKEVVHIPENYSGPGAQYELNGEFTATFDPPTVLAMIATQRELVAALNAIVQPDGYDVGGHDGMNLARARAAIAKAVGQ